MPPLKPWQIMPVPPPTLPSATGPPRAPSSAASACSGFTWKPLMSLSGRPRSRPRPAGPRAAARAASACHCRIASRTTPTLWVLVIAIGPSRKPLSWSQVVPVISPLPLSVNQAPNTGSLLALPRGWTTVTPVRTGPLPADERALRPRSASCGRPRRPATSVIASSGPACRRSGARGPARARAASRRRGRPGARRRPEPAARAQRRASRRPPRGSRDRSGSADPRESPGKRRARVRSDDSACGQRARRARRARVSARRPRAWPGPAKAGGGGSSRESPRRSAPAAGRRGSRRPGCRGGLAPPPPRGRPRSPKARSETRLHACRAPPRTAPPGGRGRRSRRRTSAR